MPRLMSVAFTEDAVRTRAKTVTRRRGWWVDRRGRRVLTPGDQLTLCRKIMGRKRGEPLVRVAEVQVRDVRREPLELVDADEVAREGFPGMSPEEFMLRFFTEAQGIQPADLVTRIEWTYLDQRAEQAEAATQRQRWRDVHPASPTAAIPGVDGREWKAVGITDLTRGRSHPDVPPCGHLAVEILLVDADHRVLARQRGHVDPDAPAIAPISPDRRSDIRGRSGCPGSAQPSLFDFEDLLTEHNALGES